MRTRTLVLDLAVRFLAKVVVVVAIVFAVVPAGLIVALSFSNQTFLSFPPSDFGFGQYSSLFQSGQWLHATLTSFEVAVPVAIFTLVVAVPAVFAIASPRMRFSGLLEAASLGPLLVPISAYVLAIYLAYLKIGITGTSYGLVFAQALGAIPVAILITASALRRVPRDLELAAMSLGASRRRAVLEITGRMLLPALAASFIVAFLFSFDDAVFVSFLGGASINTLARVIFDSLREGVDPVVTAISTLLMVFTAGLVTLVGWLRRHAR